MTTPSGAADALRGVAELIDSGLPTPVSITLFGPRPEISVRDFDLDAWTRALGLSQPTWRRAACSDCEVASWPGAELAHLPFGISSLRQRVTDETAASMPTVLETRIAETVVISSDGPLTGEDVQAIERLVRAQWTPEAAERVLAAVLDQIAADEAVQLDDEIEQLLRKRGA